VNLWTYTVSIKASFLYSSILGCPSEATNIGVSKNYAASPSKNFLT
jgi:hypothetical protein